MYKLLSNLYYLKSLININILIRLDSSVCSIKGYNNEYFYINN